MRTITAKVGDVLIGGDNPIVVQTMCNTHTLDVEATVAQCVRLRDAGAEIIRITVPGPADVECVKSIKSRLWRTWSHDTHRGGHPFFIADGDHGRPVCGEGQDQSR